MATPKFSLQIAKTAEENTLFCLKMCSFSISHIQSSLFYHQIYTFLMQQYPSHPHQPKPNIQNHWLEQKKKIYPFCKMGNLDKVIEPLYMSPKSEIELRTCCSILQLCAELESLQDGKKVHSCIYAGNLLGIWGMGGWFFYNMRNGKVFSLESNHEWVCKDRWFPRECVFV